MSEKVELERKRNTVKQAFEDFLNRPSVHDWNIEDDRILYDIITTGLEIFTGHDGKEIFRDVMTQAHALARYRKLAEYLEGGN